jgi:hypothetical protein
MRVQSSIGFVALLLIACAGCLGQQRLLDGCGESECRPCADDADCVIIGNPCSDTAVCEHRDSPHAVTQEACDLEYEPPPDADCVCRDGACGPAW